MNNEVSIQQLQTLPATPEEEIWKTHSSGYEVSSFGRVKAKYSKIGFRKHHDNGRQLLTFNAIPIAKLVLSLFQNIPYGEICVVRYKDKNYKNVKLENLISIPREKTIRREKVVSDLDGEVWAFHKKLKVFISNLGRVKSKENHLYRLYINNGYYCIQLRYKSHRVHRLVAECFIGKIPKNKIVNHKDFCRTNNNVSNLEIITRSENTLHYIKNKSANNPHAKNKVDVFIPNGVEEKWVTDKFGYSVSNIGRVKNKSGRLLKPQKVGGYINYNVSYKTKRAHKIVFEAFKGSIKDGYVINHKDGNKLNNYIENLEEVSHSENSIHAVKNGLLKAPKGQNNSRAFFTNAEIINIYNMGVKLNMHVVEIAIQNNCNTSSIRKILKGIRYSDVYSSAAGTEIRKYNIVRGYCVLK